MKLFATDADINKAIERAAKNGRAYENLLHKILVSILKRGIDTKDFRKPAKQFEALIEAAKGATRTNAMLDWITAHAPLSYNTEEKALVYTNMKGFEPALETASETPFWVFKPEQDYKPVDWAAAINSLIKRAEKDVSELGKKSKVDTNQVELLKKMVA